VVYHCSHGVHRTGTATAILLSALGVPWETVPEDYLLSNKYRVEEVNRRNSDLRLLAADTLLVEPEQ
jgi:protein-tyrosine phosphatase